MSWNTESIEAICKLDGPGFREAVLADAGRMLQGTEPEVVLQPANITDTTFKGPQSDIPIRIYTPKSDSSAKLPAIVFYQGGAYILGGLDSHDAACRRLCVKSGAIVVAVDYRVAPEHPFPAAVDDCYAAIQYVHKNADALNVDANRIAVAGDSAGATLSAVVTILARDNNGPPIKFQCLIYPTTDFTKDYSKHQPHEGSLLRKETIKYLQHNYLQDYQNREDFRVSPLKANLSRLPPAWVFVAEYDPLKAEGIAYAEKLRSQGASVELVDAPGVDHGFYTIPTNLSPDTLKYHEAAAAAIKKGLA